MKKLLKISFLYFCFSGQSLFGISFWQLMHTLPTIGQHIPTVPINEVANIENLNVLTIRPTKDCPDPLTVHEVCTRIKEGNNAENNNTCVVLEEKTKKQFFALSTNIPSGYDGIIYIHVSGYAGLSGNARYKYAGSGAYSTFNYLKGGILPNDVIYISFDGQVSYRSYFNFGQQLDQDCLNTVYEETIKKNPKASIVLFGACKGATVILNYLTNPRNREKDNHFKHIKAVLLESPSISFETIVDHIAQTHAPRLLRFMVPYLFKIYFPNYQWGQPTMLDYAANLPNNIPIFIGYLQQDNVANYKDILQIATQFKKAGKNNIELFKSSNTTLQHGHLSKAKDFQKKVKEFLKVTTT